MMRSTLNDGNGNKLYEDDDDDDEFAPNPFRSNRGGGPDFFDAATAPAAPAPAVPSSVVQQQQPQQQAVLVEDNPALYLSGPMDQNAGAGDPYFSKSAQQQVQQVQQQAPPIFSWRGIFACFRADAAARLFDVDTVDVYLRLKAAATQFHRPNYFRLEVVGDSSGNNYLYDPQQQQQQQQQQAAMGAVVVTAHNSSSNTKGPDLYGPVWVSMTLMFILGMTANLSDYIKRDADAEFEYDLTHVLNAMYICFLFTFGLPTAFWLACHCLGMPGISWATWTCHYGYSLTPVIMGALVAWWLPYDLYHWLVLAIAVAASGLLIVRNLSAPLLSQDTASVESASSAHAKAAPLLLSILGAHFAYLLVLKLTFYP